MKIKVETQTKWVWKEFWLILLPGWGSGGWGVREAVGKERENLTVPCITEISNELKPFGKGSLPLEATGQAPENKSLMKPESHYAHPCTSLSYSG